MSKKLTHIDAKGTPRMVDVSAKNITRRVAMAEAKMLLPNEVMEGLKGGELVTKKGPVFHTAIIAGTQAVKKTADLIPFCHTIPIEHCRIAIVPNKTGLTITCEVATTGKTGVEMEALTGATVAALNVYDMCKALSHAMEISHAKLVKKTGGKRDVNTRGTS